MADGNERLQFRVPADVATFFRSLADAEGGAAALIATVVSAASLTREARQRTGETFTAWLAGYAELEAENPDGPPGAEEAEAARRAEIEMARAEGFAAGQREGSREATKNLDFEWTRLRAERDRTAQETQRERAEIARLRRELDEDRIAFDQETADALAWANAERERHNADRARADDALINAGRRDLYGALTTLDRNGSASRYVLGLVRDAAREIIREQMQGAIVAPEISLTVAARLIQRAAEAVGNPTIGRVVLETPQGPQAFSPFWRGEGRRDLPFDPHLRSLGLIVEAIAGNHPLSIAALPQREIAGSEMEPPLAYEGQRALPAPSDGDDDEGSAQQVPRQGRGRRKKPPVDWDREGELVEIALANYRAGRRA